jgi:hypothetical protein
MSATARSIAVRQAAIARAKADLSGAPDDALGSIRAAADMLLESPAAEFEGWLRRHPKRALWALDDLDEAIASLQLLRQSFARCV